MKEVKAGEQPGIVDGVVEICGRTLTCIQDGRVLVHRGGGVGLITMNRTQKRNALDTPQINALAAAFDWLRQDDEVRVAVLTGGEKAFCAGGDITMFEDMGPDDGLPFTRRGYELLRPLETGVKPVIAAVNGFCLAGGLELALACDFIIAARDATFGFGEVELGLIPGWGGTVRLARAIPVRLARQWTLTSERVSAERAAAVGLVNELVDGPQVLDRALAVAEQIAGQPTQAVQAAKLIAGEAADASMDAALAAERLAAGALFGTSAVRARVRAWNQSSASRRL
jgi:enoyl-CoA hydratase